MGVSNPVKYVLRLSLFTNKRTEQQQHRQHHSSSPISPISPSTTWKGKEIDSDPPIEVRWGAVQYPDDYAALTDVHAHMAVSAIDSDLGSSSSSSRSRSSGSSSRTGLVRVVSWASLAGDRCRWTMEQERRLAIARSELARCQKAWSSEQELWLAQIEKLHEEKEAHEQFIHHRAKQQDEEQQHFRKSWIRRKSYEEQQQQLVPTTQRTNSRLRRIRRIGS
ncbi:hypothetical protein AnigIFM63604_007680 [Aspergillus niger]|uniref:Uncharacterized protein n=2 Tax=Aspergillus TaxID=5052 RepID=A0A370PNS5_ASPPH|nr:hypothetical protein M752DRAFT_292004 [Aspergillus phoenicis ATCC 13157]GKZ87672.1 hypothetical protein AnigIFM59636_005582 [Aspergillus niger]GLA22337.1 hypothetical protein AnigIFM63326_003249 [Aspergillus niger]GLA51318.1 hypothetical protein AnigIFM63604_007680 [Aspergillus niger]